jgi:hypothetical protein
MNIINYIITGGEQGGSSWQFVFQRKLDCYFLKIVLKEVLSLGNSP